MIAKSLMFSSFLMLAIYFGGRALGAIEAKRRTKYPQKVYQRPFDWTGLCGLGLVLIAFYGAVTK